MTRDRVTWVSEIALAEAHTTKHIGLLWAMSAGDAGQLRIDNWLHEQGLGNKVLVAVLGVQALDGRRLDAHAKVVVRGRDCSFEHVEPYIQFPSDHFKTKILMVTGGA